MSEKSFIKCKDRQLNSISGIFEKKDSGIQWTIFICIVIVKNVFITMLLNWDSFWIDDLPWHVFAD